MYRLRTEDYVKSRFISLWSMLAFQAGFINSIGFLACHRFVSHVTGFSTQVGMTLGDGNFWLALEMFIAPIAFVGGAWFNGWLTVARSAKGQKPRYDLATLAIPFLLLILLMAGLNGFFGKFGEPLLLSRDFFLLGGLSFLCGLQNACFATLTKGQIRTTHLTGISTDFGTDLALTLHARLPEPEHSLTIRRNILRAMTFLSFSLGALISALVDSHLQYWSFTVPLATSTFVAFVFFAFKISIDASEPQTRPSPVNSRLGPQLRHLN